MLPGWESWLCRATSKVFLHLEGTTRRPSPEIKIVTVGMLMSGKKSNLVVTPRLLSEKIIRHIQTKL